MLAGQEVSPEVHLGWNFGYNRREELSQPGSHLRWSGWLSSVSPDYYRHRQYHPVYLHYPLGHMEEDREG